MTKTPKDYMEEQYSSKNFGTRMMHVGRLNQLIPLIPQNTKSLLDVGCGGGHLIQKIFSNNPDIKIMGIDISEEGTKSTKEKCRDAEIITADVSEYDFGERKFDTIICTEVIEHIENYELVIEKMESLLEKDGTLIISFPNERNITIGRFLLGRRPIKILEHVNSFNPKEVRELINLKVQRELSVPSGLPWELSLAWIMCFKKKEQKVLTESLIPVEKQIKINIPIILIAATIIIGFFVTIIVVAESIVKECDEDPNKAWIAAFGQCRDLSEKTIEQNKLKEPYAKRQEEAKQK